jgi:RecA-family ATPase
MTDETITVTFFEHASARFKSESQLSIAELVELIENSHAERKDMLRWLKLARFGNATSGKASLRHDANVQAVSGVEADYDLERMSIEAAADLLRQYNVLSIVYTSPSHTPEKPRYRVLCPFSQLLQPSERARMAARLNGVLGGVIAAESFTLSQSYYFGFLTNGEGEPIGAHQVIVVEGTPIDLLTDLDKIAIGKAGKKQAGNGNGQHYTDSEFIEVEELMRRILAGEALHTSATSLAGKYARDGQPIEYAIATIKAVFTAANQPRYEGRWPEILEAIQWVYAREARKGGSSSSSSSSEPPPLPWLSMASWDLEPPAPIEYVVRDRIPARQVCLFTGHGASGKSTIALNLCCATVLGKDWLKSMPEFGPCMFIDAEDDEQVLHHRLYANTLHYQTTFAQLIDDGLHILPMAGKDCVMATVDRNGLVTPRPFYKQVLDAARNIKPKITVLASLANMFTGSENDRSQAQQFVSLLTEIAIVSGGAVILIAHPSLTGISTNTGISGSTAWFNSVRAQIYLRTVTDKDDEQPDTDLRVLEFKKNQYGKIEDTQTLSWRSGMFLPIGAASVEKIARENRINELFVTLLKRFSSTHRPVSPSPRSGTYAPALFATEDEATALKANRKELEAAMRRLLATGAVLIKNFGRPSNPRPYLVLPTTPEPGPDE